MDRLHWEVSKKGTGNFVGFLEDTVSFLRIYIGDVREAVAHTDQISKYGRVIYNEMAWDTDKFKEIKEDITQPDHHAVIKEVILRVEKYKCTKVDLGYVSKWKNPYQIAETHMPTGITVTYEDKEDSYVMHASFFAPELWFNLQCKPLFKTDPIVEKDPKGSWNMNPAGLIAAKPEKCAGNRRAMFNMLTDFLKDIKPNFSGLAISELYYNTKTGTAYLVNPEAKDREELLPLMFSFKESGKILQSDSSEIPKDPYGSIQVEDIRVYFDKKHFDFM